MRIRHTLIRALIVLVLSVPSGLRAQTELFDRATEAYNEERYEEAAETYRAILAKGLHSPELYFNLGNCHYKMGDIAYSNYYFEKARRLAPNDPDILNNLEYARNMRLDAIQPVPRSFLDRMGQATVGIMGYEGWGRLAIFMAFLFSLAFLIYQFHTETRWKRLAFVIACSAMILTLVTFAAARSALSAHRADNPAIVFAPAVGVSSAPNERGEVRFDIHEGTSVQVTESLEEWVRIRLVDGQTGWIPSESVKLLKEGP